jgi:hypothetical protein
MSSNRHSAAGANAGFGYQFDRALHWLAQSPAGSSIGIETDDDVAVRNPDASLLLEQDKHSIREAAQPFGDRSKDLWNTLAIWLDAIDSKQILIESTAFLMVTNKALPECIVKRISRANSDDEVATCIADLEKAGETPPKDIASLVERVLRVESRTMLSGLIAKIELADASDGTTGPELRRRTIAQMQLPDWCSSTSDSIANELSGWLHNMAMSSWQQNQPAWVQRDHFVNQLHAILARRTRQISRERAEHLIPITDDKIGREKGRPFVKQLYLVTDDDTVVDTAIREYIRCNIEKARLSREGNVTDDDWEAFQMALVSRWKKIRSRVTRLRSGTTDENVGFDIFTETTEDHREKLAGTDTEQVYLSSGTYHRLADLRTVGWHPRYEALMQELLKAQ